MTSTKLLNVVQVNLQKAKMAQIEIGRKIKAFNKNNTPFICLVQEPKVSNGRPSWQPNSCKKYHAADNPRTAIYTDNNTNAWALESFNTKDITAIQTRINKKEVIIASVYLDINWIQVVPEALNKLMIYAETRGLGLILGMDSNCHSQLFGPTSNKRGENLELFIAKYNLQIENNCHTPTYESRGAKTCIDVTLTTRLSVSIMDWNVCQQENGSDHNTILYNLSTSTTKIEPQWLWSKANWDLFQSCLLYTSPSPRDRQKSRMPSSA